MRRAFFSPLPALLLALLLTTVALAQSGGTYNLEWITFDGGGATFSSGGPYALGGTAGQPDAGNMNGGAYTLNGGFWNGVIGRPTSVLLVLFRGAYENHAVNLQWITSVEEGTRGFNVWRSRTRAGTYTQLNAEPIAAVGSGAGGATYTYADTTAGKGKNFFKLEMVGEDGSEWSDIVRVNVDSAGTCVASKPSLVAPRDKARVRQLAVTLQWNAVPCATHYVLVVRREGKKGHVVHREKQLATTEFTTRELNTGKTYYWQVRACDANACKKSAWRTFTVRD